MAKKGSLGVLTVQLSKGSILTFDDFPRDLNLVHAVLGSANKNSIQKYLAEKEAEANTLPPSDKTRATILLHCEHILALLGVSHTKEAYVACHALEEVLHKRKRASDSSAGGQKSAKKRQHKSRRARVFARKYKAAHPRASAETVAAAILEARILNPSTNQPYEPRTIARWLNRK